MKSLKQPFVYIGLGILVLLIATFFLTLNPTPLQGEAVIVKRSDIMREVFITGTVRATRKVSLSFDRGGIIKSLPFPVGTIAPAGILIAFLQNESEYASVLESRALVAIEEANLAKIREGTREEELQLKEAELRKAEVSLQNSKNKTLSTLADAYSAGEESLSRYAAPFFSDDDGATPRLTYSSGTQEAYNAEEKRLRAGKSVLNLQKATQGGFDSMQALENAREDLRVVQDMFVTLGLTLRDGMALESNLLADYRSRVTSARSALASVIVSVQNQMGALQDGEAEVERVTRALLLSRAKATKETITGAEQELAQAKARLRGAEALFERTLLRAPFRGEISSKDAEVGETIQAGKVIMEFLGTDGFTIEANVPEADVAKLEESAFAEVTLDAYGDDIVFPARVALIEPSSTEIDGVPTYKTTFEFEKQDPKFLSGLTANIIVKNLSKKNVLIIPSRAVVAEDGKSFVTKILANGSTEKAEVRVGDRSGTREVEIIEGLKEGERIILPELK